LTAAGAAARQQIEETTDRLSVEPWDRIGDEATEELEKIVSLMVVQIADLELIPTLNPIGLPPHKQ
jgi:hypothetical protein